LDDLLLAGINLADNIVIVNKESSNAGEEDTLSDCNTIVAVQSIFRSLKLNHACCLLQEKIARAYHIKYESSFSYYTLNYNSIVGIA